MEKKKSTLIWHIMFIIVIGGLVYLVILNVELISGCPLYWMVLDCATYRIKLWIYTTSLAFVIIIYVFYIRRLVPSVPKRDLASTRVKQVMRRDDEEKVEPEVPEE